MKKGPEYLNGPTARALDLSAVVGLGSVLVPASAIAALAVFAQDRGRPTYSEQRVGKGGELFTLKKLRSFKRDADTAHDPLMSACDPRISALGKILRRTSIDETPQLKSILRGDMHFVAPRALSEEQRDYIREVVGESSYNEWDKTVSLVAPGCVSAVRLIGGRELLRTEEGVHRYIESDIVQVEEASLANDLALIARVGLAFPSLQGHY